MLPLLLLPASSPHWTQVNAPGFGEHAGPYTGQEAFDLTVYEGRLYLGMEGKACARIWRTRAGVTAPGSQADWEQVVANGFDGTTDCAVTPPTTDNDHIDSLEPFGGFLYASTAMQSGARRGTQVWRSATGDAGAWMRVNTPGFGDPANQNFKDMIAFGGYLCGGASNAGDDATRARPGAEAGAQVWCSDGVTPDPAAPEQLLWTQRNVSGFGDPANVKIWSSATHDGALYFGVEAEGADGSFWRTRNIDDPLAWERVFSPADLGLSGSRVDALASFGDRLFIGMEASGLGARVFSSASGDRGTWKLAGAGFGPTTGRFISDAATVLADRLYVATLDMIAGVGIWETRDGQTWTRVAPAGFGTPETFAAELIGFAGRLYAWTSNYVAGQGVWRRDLAP